MDGRRLRWGGGRFSCCITSCGRPFMTNIQSGFTGGFHARTCLVVSWSWFDSSDFWLIFRAKILFLLKLLADNIPGIGLVARESSFTHCQHFFRPLILFILLYSCIYIIYFNYSAYYNSASNRWRFFFCGAQGLWWTTCQTGRRSTSTTGAKPWTRTCAENRHWDRLKSRYIGCVTSVTKGQARWGRERGPAASSSQRRSTFKQLCHSFWHYCIFCPACFPPAPPVLLLIERLPSQECKW